MKNIFVGNLGIGASEKSVRELFESYGTVGRVKVVTDRESGYPLGFGFVEMANRGEREKAIAAVNGLNVSGHTLHVNHANQKADRWAGTKLDGIVLSVCGPIMRVAIRNSDDAAQFRFQNGQWIAEDGLPVTVTFLSPFNDDGLDTWLDADPSPLGAAVHVD